MNLETWKSNYSVLQDLTITFQESGNIQPDNISQYCHCPRNQKCTEYETNYELELVFKFGR